MGFPILVRWHLYIESGPWVLHFILHCTPNDKSVVTICSMISILFEIIMYNDSNTYSTVYNEGIDLNRRVPFHQFCVWYEDCIKIINIVFPVRPITRKRKHFYILQTFRSLNQFHICCFLNWLGVPQFRLLGDRFTKAFDVTVQRYLESHTTIKVSECIFGGVWVKHFDSLWNFTKHFNPYAAKCTFMPCHHTVDIWLCGLWFVNVIFTRGQF